MLKRSCLCSRRLVSFRAAWVRGSGLVQTDAECPAYVEFID